MSTIETIAILDYLKTRVNDVMLRRSKPHSIAICQQQALRSGAR